jgi:hypothetical protein
MKDLKIVLLYFSFSMGSFLAYLLVNLLFFFAVIAVTIMMFVLGYISHLSWLFPVYLAASVVLVFWGLRKFFFKRRLGLNMDFTRFLVHMAHLGDDGAAESTIPAKMEFPQDLGNIVKEVKDSLIGHGIKCIPNKLLIALTAARICDQQPTSETAQLDLWKGFSSRLSLLEIVGFVVLFIPFGLISFIFTLGMDSTITQLIYGMGFFFAWFLHASIVMPIVGLILQRKMSGIF